MTLDTAAIRLLAVERGQRSLSPRALWWRLARSTAGAFLINAPVFQLKENLKLEASTRVLDVGCGNGAALRILDQRAQFEHPPVGTDISQRALRSARAANSGGRRYHYIEGTATDLPFADRSFDLVVSGYLVSQLDEDELRTFATEVRRVLAPGGLALLWDFAPTGNPRLDAWNERVVAIDGLRPRLRSTRALMALAELVGFEYIRAARLRPFLLPPIPRASVLLGKPPEGWAG
jgi:SAM-dependent methyltransferase